MCGSAHLVAVGHRAARVQERTRCRENRTTTQRKNPPCSILLSDCHTPPRTNNSPLLPLSVLRSSLVWCSVPRFMFQTARATCSLVRPSSNVRLAPAALPLYHYYSTTTYHHKASRRRKAKKRVKMMNDSSEHSSSGNAPAVSSAQVTPEEEHARISMDLEKVGLSLQLIAESIVLFPFLSLVLCAKPCAKDTTRRG